MMGRGLSRGCWGEGGEGELENGSRMYSQSPVGVLMDRVMCSFWRWGQNGVGEGLAEEVLGEEAR